MIFNTRPAFLVDARSPAPRQPRRSAGRDNPRRRTGSHRRGGDSGAAPARGGVSCSRSCQTPPAPPLIPVALAARGPPVPPLPTGAPAIRESRPLRTERGTLLAPADRAAPLRSYPATRGSPRAGSAGPAALLVQRAEEGSDAGAWGSPAGPGAASSAAVLPRRGTQDRGVRRPRGAEAAVRALGGGATSVSPPFFPPLLRPPARHHGERETPPPLTGRAGRGSAASCQAAPAAARLTPPPCSGGTAHARQRPRGREASPPRRPPSARRGGGGSARGCATRGHPQTRVSPHGRHPRIVRIPALHPDLRQERERGSGLAVAAAPRERDRCARGEMSRCFCRGLRCEQRTAGKGVRDRWQGMLRENLRQPVPCAAAAPRRCRHRRLARGESRCVPTITYSRF